MTIQELKYRYPDLKEGQLADIREYAKSVATKAIVDYTRQDVYKERLTVAQSVEKTLSFFEQDATPENQTKLFDADKI